jgi:hypothetical protein
MTRTIWDKKPRNDERKGRDFGKARNVKMA